MRNTVMGSSRREYGFTPISYTLLLYYYSEESIFLFLSFSFFFIEYYKIEKRKHHELAFSVKCAISRACVHYILYIKKEIKERKDM
jgi:hypothetical protein